MATKKQIEFLEEEVQPTNIAPKRNKHTHSFLSHDEEKNYNINIDYENFTEIDGSQEKE